MRVLLFLAGFLAASSLPAQVVSPEADFARALGAVESQASEGASRFKQGRKPLGLGYLPKMVMIVEDDATDDWGKAAPSKYDGQPILGPATPSKRLREVWVRLQGRLNAMAKPPLVVAWDYYFPIAPKPESPATDEVAELFSKAPFPVVLGSTRLHGPLESRVHRDGPNRFQGHIIIWEDAEKHRFSPVSPMDHRLHDVPDEDTFVEATVAAVLSRKRRLPKDEAWAQARTLAQEVSAVMPAEEKGTYNGKDDKGPAIDYDVKGIKLIERPVPIVSIKDVILGEPAALRAVEGAIVIVGNTITDNGDLFGDGHERSKGLVHAWTILQLLGSRLN